MRIILLILAFYVVFLPANAFAAKKRYASIVVVEETGEVLHARYADQYRHPASLTKVMTLYLLFDALSRGELGMDDVMRISAKAAKARPSKLGLKAGETITVENAIRALVTKSANDVAIVVAERMAGNEGKFAGEMTRMAKLLGMSRTRFANASGLPDKRQISTARDMAALTAAIQHDFPAMFHYFSLKKFIYKKRSYGNHNSLVGRIDGVDGLKTGYTNASGYNVIVTAKRDEQRLIVVVFGGATAVQRDAHAKDLLHAGFAELSNRNTLLAANTPPPTVTELAPRAIVPPTGLNGQIEQGSAGPRGVQIIIEGQDHPNTPRLNVPAIRDKWLIQVGAYSLRNQAEARLQSVSGLSLGILAKASPIVEASPRADGVVYRARFRGLQQQSATGACKALRKRGEACFALAAQK